MSGVLRCPACGSDRVEALATVGPVPVLCGSLWDSRAEAQATPTAVLHMVCCSGCAHVWNADFDPALVEYDARYDNALDFSATFSSYAEGLVKRLVDDFDLRGRRIAEIGSGKGEFLRALCAAGGSRGIGYDPTYEGPDVEGEITFIREFFTPRTAPGDVDFVCCRHVLEHLEDPHQFLLDVRAAVDDRPVPMYFEVPNAEFNFAESGPWDLIYPHVGYFSDTSLRALLSRSGYRVISLEPAYAGQFLAAEVVPEGSSTGVGQWAQGRAQSLTQHYRLAMARQLTGMESWRERIEAVAEGDSIGLWGAGSKGVTFLALIDPSRSIDTVVDANPRKVGRYLPGAGHRIVAPQEVAQRQVSSVLVMNPAYAEEIGQSLADTGARARVLVV